MKRLKSAWFAGLFSVFIAPGAFAQSAGEGGQAGDGAEVGGASVEPAGAGGEAGASGESGAGAAAGGLAGSGGAAAGAAGGAGKPNPTTRTYPLLENDARACSIGAGGRAGVAAPWALVVAGMTVLLVRRRRIR